MKPIEICGYAIVSDDNMIADKDGQVPPSLRNEVDWAQYQAALAASDLIVFARVSHENEPNMRGDRRVVVSRDANGLEQRADAWWWNPAQVGWDDVLKRALPEGGRVAAPGGRGVFDLFLGIGYDAFHLARARGVKLPGGHLIFSECKNASAQSVLERHGLRLAEQVELDVKAGVDMLKFRRVDRKDAIYPSATHGS